MKGKTYEEIYGKERAKIIKKKVIESHKGYKRSDESKLKQSKTLKKQYKEGKRKVHENSINSFKNCRIGSKLTEKHKKSISDSVQKRLKNGTHIFQTIWNNKNYKEKHIKTVINNSMKCLYSLEKKFLEIVKKYNLPYKYVGNGDFLLGFKNPDFININGEKICIEVYYPYFKIRDYKSCKNYEESRTNHFKKYAWKTIFLTNEDLKNEEKTLLKIGGI